MQKLSAKIALEVTKRHLEVPAIMLLEMHKPVANFNAHLMLGVGGFFAPLLGFELFNDLTRLLAKRDNIERLLEAIEEQAANRGKPEAGLQEGSDNPCNTTIQAG